MWSHTPQQPTHTDFGVFCVGLAQWRGMLRGASRGVTGLRSASRSHVVPRSTTPCTHALPHVQHQWKSLASGAAERSGRCARANRRLTTTAPQNRRMAVNRTGTLARHMVTPSRNFHAAVAASSAAQHEAGMALARSRMRNVAIIAHVDHGKTTLVDTMLKHTGTRLTEGKSQADEDTADRVMDSNTLEKERGITILSKCTAVYHEHDNDLYRINIVDTPGHADFGGEVERVLSMVDGVVLVVCASEGPMTQTKFVLKKALDNHLKPVVVINKADRPSARVRAVENEIFDLFVELEANDEQLDYKTIFASARSGWATTNRDLFDERGLLIGKPEMSMTDLFTAVVQELPEPNVDQDDDPFRMLVSLIGHDAHLGKTMVGRIKAGTVKTGDTLKALSPDGKAAMTGKIPKLFSFHGVEQVPVEKAHAGDIVSIAGFLQATVRHTMCAPDVTEPIPSTPIDPPTLSMIFSVNNSPLAGRDGTKLTSSLIYERLQKECETNVSLQMIPGTSEAVEIRGRGELQLGVLLETLRREGFELSVSPPKVVFHTQDGQPFIEDTERPMKKSEMANLLEPIEEVDIDVAQEHSGQVVEKMSRRKATLLESESSGENRVRMKFWCPTRGLIGYRSEFINDTRGSGTMNQLLKGYEPYLGHFDKSDKGAIISMADGTAALYSLGPLQSRGTLFINPGDRVYPGMVIGESSRSVDVECNPSKAKQLNNIRNVLAEEKIRLGSPKMMTIEEMIAYVRDDEVIEVCPSVVRLRKKELDANVRKRHRRAANM